MKSLDEGVQRQSFEPLIELYTFFLENTTIYLWIVAEIVNAAQRRYDVSG